MIQCETCEFYRRDEAGRVSFACDPFVNVREPECLQKWQLIKINQMVEAYQATLSYYRKLAPMQDKLFKAMERELGDIEDSENWKTPAEEDEEPGQESENKPQW